MDERMSLLASARKHAGYLYRGICFIVGVILTIVGVVGGVLIVGLLCTLPFSFAEGSGNNLWLLLYTIHFSLIGYFIGKERSIDP